MPYEDDSDIPAKESGDQATTNIVARKSDSRDREFAKYLHEKAYIYALYGALDGLSLSYSMVKYGFDLLAPSSAASSDMMHEWMLTPAGMAAAAAESIAIIGFSLLANVFKDSDKNAFKSYIAVLWPYFRDTLKGLKNAYKGVRSTLQVASIFAVQDLRYMILPMGIVLGVLSAANRIYYRRIVEKRKIMMVTNGDLLREIKSKADINADDKERYLAVIQQQENFLKTVKQRSMLSQVYSGIVDGLYLYMGAMGLAALAPPVFIAMSVLCLVFTLACIASRVYEEYDYQRKLMVSQAKIKFAICGKELHALFATLQILSYPNSNIVDLEQRKKTLHIQLEEKLLEFKIKKGELRSQLNLTYTSAALAGLRNGLAAYGAIASVMFAVATISAIMLAPFPPAFLIAAIISGTACLLGFMAHALFTNYIHLSKQKGDIDNPHKNLSELLRVLKKNENEIKNLTPEAYKDAIRGDIILDPSPQFFFQEWFEVTRSFTSGLSKGQKSVDYTFNPLQELDNKGHYQDTPMMLGLTVLSSAVYASGLALRAYARSFGRSPVEEPLGDLGLSNEPHGPDGAAVAALPIANPKSMRVADIITRSPKPSGTGESVVHHGPDSPISHRAYPVPILVPAPAPPPPPPDPTPSPVYTVTPAPLHIPTSVPNTPVSAPLARGPSMLNRAYSFFHHSETAAIDSFGTAPGLR